MKRTAIWVGLASTLVLACGHDGDGSLGSGNDDVAAPDAGCTVTEGDDGTHAVTCGDSTVTVRDGMDGARGAKGKDGEDEADGIDGEDGVPRSVVQPDGPLGAAGASGDGPGGIEVTCSDAVTTRDFLACSISQLFR